MKRRILWTIVTAALSLLLLGGWYFAQFSSQPETSLEKTSLAATEAAAELGIPTKKTPSEASTAKGANAEKESNFSTDQAEIRLAKSLESIYVSALQAVNPEDRAAAFRMASICLAIEGGIPTLTKMEAVQFSGIRLEEAGNTLARRQEAASRLRAFCATGNASSFLEELRKRPQPTLGPIFRSAHVFKGGQVAEQQQNLQSFTQLLANPDRYPVQFDAWLDSDAFLAITRQLGLNGRQSAELGNILVERFVSNPDLLQIRKWRICINQLVCSDQGGSETISAAAATIEANIRTQRWSALQIK